MKKSRIWFALIALAVGCITAPLQAADITHQPSNLDRIAEDYRNGELTLDQRVIYQIQAIKYPEKLPQKYQPAGLSAAGGPSHGCATTALIEIQRDFNQLEASTQTFVQEAMARVTSQFEFVSPSGFFRVHYDLTGADAVSGVDADVSGVPDYVEQIAAYLDTSLVHHQSLGYLMPPSDNGLGGDNLFDVYFEDMSFYGYAQPEGPGPESWNDYYSYLVMHNTFIGFPPNTDPEGDIAGAAKATAAHEFHHCIQFAYDVFEATWYMELDATTTEDLVFDAVNDNYNYLPYFTTEPEKSLMDESIHMYASFIFGMYLAEKFDTSMGVAAWEGARFAGIVSTLDDTLQARYGWSLDSAVADFAAWNFATGVRDDGLHYSEGGSYPAVEINATHSTYPVTLRNSPVNPAGYASCYVSFFPGSAQGSLRLTFNGSDSRQWAAWAIASSADDVHTFIHIPLAAVSYFGEIDIPNFQNYDRVTLVGVNLTESSSGAAYAYKASIVVPHAVATQLLSTDSVIYSGGIRQYQVQISNESDFQDIVNLTVSDDQGWTTFGTKGYSLPAHDDSIVTVSIHPPAGTPIGTVANVLFRATAAADPTAADSSMLGIEAIIQHGDVDFNGVYDPVDLSYLVDYFFLEGIAPQPVLLSADVSCDQAVDPVDLSFMIDYFYSNGISSSCNPY